MSVVSRRPPAEGRGEAADGGFAAAADGPQRRVSVKH